MLRNTHVSFEMRLIFKIIIVILLFILSFSFIFQAFRKGVSVSSKSTSSFTYQLCNDFSCFSDDSYSSDEIDSVPVTFSYQFSYPGNSPKKFYYYVISKTEIYNGSGKLLKQGEEVLLERTKFQAIGDTKIEVPVTFSFREYYQKLLEQSSTDIVENVSIQLIIDDMESEKVVSEMLFHFDKDTFQFKKSSSPKEEKNYFSVNSYDMILASIGLLFALSGLLMVIHISNFVSRCLKRSMNYTDRVERILRVYDKYIVICRGTYEQDPNKRIIEVPSFKELMDARNHLSVPIVYEKINNVKCRFYVEDIDKIYLYTMKDVSQEK